MVSPARIEKCCLTETTEPGPKLGLLHTHIVFFLTAGVQDVIFGLWSSVGLYFRVVAAVLISK